MSHNDEFKFFIRTHEKRSTPDYVDIQDVSEEPIVY